MSVGSRWSRALGSLVGLSGLRASQGESRPCYTEGRPGVYCGGEHTLLRHPKTGEVYQLGGCGLGFDHDKPKASKYVAKVPVTAAEVIIPGYYHNLLRQADGQCFAYGCGRQAPNDGQLGKGTTDEDTTPVPIASFETAGLGGHHTVATRENGGVWAAGAGWQGQMGNGTLDYANPVLQTPSNLPPITRVKCGYYHTAARDREGRWWVWGSNEQGQLGDDKKHVKKPALLPMTLSRHKIITPVADVDGGYGHTLLLLEDGRVLTLGNHSEGQRGIDPEAEDEEVPVVNEVAVDKVTAIAAGSHHNLVVVAGEVYAWGSDEFGQVSGGGPPAEDADHRTAAVTKVQGLPNAMEDPVVHVSAGIAHSAAQTASGRIFVWGCGSNGQVGDLALPEASKVREINPDEVARQSR